MIAAISKCLGRIGAGGSSMTLCVYVSGARASDYQINSKSFKGTKEKTYNRCDETWFSERCNPYCRKFSIFSRYVGDTKYKSLTTSYIDISN